MPLHPPLILKTTSSTLPPQTVRMFLRLDKLVDCKRLSQDSNAISVPRVTLVIPPFKAIYASTEMKSYSLAQIYQSKIVEEYMESRMGGYRSLKLTDSKSESSRHGGRGPGLMLTPSTTRSSRHQHAAPFPDLFDTPTIDMLPPNYRAPRRLTATPVK